MKGKGNRVSVHHLIDTILKSLKQFDCSWEEEWDGGTYFDNFVDGGGY